MRISNDNWNLLKHILKAETKFPNPANKENNLETYFNSTWLCKYLAADISLESCPLLPSYKNEGSQVSIINNPEEE